MNESKPIRKESSQLYTSLQHDAHSSIEDTSLIQEVEIGLSEIDESDTTNGGNCNNLSIWIVVSFIINQMHSFAIQ